MGLVQLDRSDVSRLARLGVDLSFLDAPVFGSLDVFGDLHADRDCSRVGGDTTRGSRTLAEVLAAPFPCGCLAARVRHLPGAWSLGYLETLSALASFEEGPVPSDPLGLSVLLVELDETLAGIADELTAVPDELVPPHELLRSEVLARRSALVDLLRSPEALERTRALACRSLLGRGAVSDGFVVPSVPAPLAPLLASEGAAEVVLAPAFNAWVRSSGPALEEAWTALEASVGPAPTLVSQLPPVPDRPLQEGEPLGPFLAAVWRDALRAGLEDLVSSWEEVAARSLADSSQRVVVFDTRRLRSCLAPLVCASYSFASRGTVHLLVLPGPVADALLLGSESGLLMDSPRSAGDTDRVLDTFWELWSPTDPASGYCYPSVALEAARALGDRRVRP